MSYEVGWHEGRVVLCFSYKNTKIKTDCWTTIKDLPKKISCTHSKTKKWQQDDRMDVFVPSSTTIPTKWATHKLENNYITEVLQQKWKFWAPIQASQPESLASGGGTPKTFCFGGQWTRNAGAPQDCETETLFLEGIYKVSCTWNPSTKQ